MNTRPLGTFFLTSYQAYLYAKSKSRAHVRASLPRSARLIALLTLSLLMLTACDRPSAAGPTPTPAATPLPAIQINATSGSIRAAANVLPAELAELSFPTTGRIVEIATAVGDDVAPGDVLIRLNPAAAEAAVEQAQAALFQAQAALGDLIDGPRAEEIRMAQAQLDVAQARLDQLAESARPAEVAAAQADLRAAQSAYQQLFNGPREEERIDALAALSNAEAARQQAQSAYNQVAWQSNVGMLPESRQLQEATNNLEAAQAHYDALFADPVTADIAAAQAQIEQAQARLDALQAPGSANQVAEAAAQLRSAQAQLDLLTAGARDGELAAAAVAVNQAEAELKRAQAALDDLTLRAPFAGVVTEIAVNPGEMVQPGEIALTLADLAHLQLATTDLSERDVARVAPGQAVDVFIEALNERYPGRVVRIAPEADTIGGDVVYPVTIELDDQPAALRWGMSADVDILAE